MEAGIGAHTPRSATQTLKSAPGTSLGSPQIPPHGDAVTTQSTLDDADLEALLSASSPKLRAIFALCRWAGLRRGEALALQVRDVEAGVARIRAKPLNARGEEWRPKSLQRRTVRSPRPRLRSPAGWPRSAAKCDSPAARGRPGCRRS